MPKYVEILGLEASNNNRSCVDHRVCGIMVKKGSVLLTKPVVILNENNQNEYAIAAIMMNDGVESCTVGYIGREFHFFREQYENRLIQVVECLQDSANTEHRRRSHLNKGIAVCVLLN
jgi:hypothetical protein